ncbi:MAG TPA: hypothetical protein VMF55_12895 [Solirubrobacterales bacterium]|nr:hypothetical protein [Solirubrobacterales bacterium]
MSPSVEEIRRAAESRMRELEPVMREIAQLQRILAVTEEGTEADDLSALAEAMSNGASSGHAAPAAAGDGVVRPRRRADGRSVRGSNKAVIMKLVRENPGIAAPEVAARTDLKREVVSATIYRLKRQKILEDYGEGVRVATAPAKKRRFIAELVGSRPGITVAEIADVAGLDPAVTDVTIEHMVAREELALTDAGLTAASA